jgi:hypothetical protein
MRSTAILGEGDLASGINGQVAQVTRARKDRFHGRAAGRCRYIERAQCAVRHEVFARSGRHVLREDGALTKRLP